MHPMLCSTHFNPVSWGRKCEERQLTSSIHSGDSAGERQGKAGMLSPMILCRVMQATAFPYSAIQHKKQWEVGLKLGQKRK